MSWDISEIKNWDWRKHPRAGLIREAGNASKFKTGGWRSARPIWDEEKCSQCLLCYVFCPDSCITVNETKMTGIDYHFCKGCGICAYECPRDAITMNDEAEELKKEEARRG